MVSALIGLMSLIVLLFAFYTVISIFYPLRPFSSRKQALAGIVGCLVLMVVLGSTIETIEGAKDRVAQPTDEKAEKQEAALKVETVAAEDLPATCEEGGIALKDVVAVTGVHQLRAEPAEGAALIKNVKASRILKVDHFHRIDRSTTVRRLCVQENWTKVQLVEPKWLRHVRGWAPNIAFRTIETDPSGSRVYVEADFLWDSETRPYKDQIVEVINRIARDHGGCNKISTSSVARSATKGSASDPVFFVTCGEMADAFNVWFKPSDADNGTRFAAKSSIAQPNAVDACEQAAKLAANHPSTVDFSRVWDMAFMPHISGRATVLSSFTAKNGLGLEIKHRIKCLFDGTELIETVIAESLD